MPSRAASWAWVSPCWRRTDRTLAPRRGESSRMGALGSRPGGLAARGTGNRHLRTVSRIDNLYDLRVPGLPASTARHPEGARRIALRQPGRHVPCTTPPLRGAPPRGRAEMRDHQTTIELPPGMEVDGPLPAGAERVLTPGALRLVAELKRTHRERVEELLERRRELQARLDAGERLEFLEATEPVREGEWKVEPPPA